MKRSPEQRRTKREVFLTEMDALIPWEECIRLIEPHWTGGTRRCEQLLRMFLLQIWFRLPDDAVQDEICDSCAMTAFMRLDFAAGEQVPGAEVLREFRSTMTVNGLQEKFFAIVQRPLARAGKKVGSGTIIDAAIVDPSHS